MTFLFWMIWFTCHSSVEISLIASQRWQALKIGRKLNNILNCCNNRQDNSNNTPLQIQIKLPLPRIMYGVSKFILIHSKGNLIWNLSLPLIKLSRVLGYEFCSCQEPKPLLTQFGIHYRLVSCVQCGNSRLDIHPPPSYCIPGHCLKWFQI